MLEVGRLRALLATSEHGGPSGAARALGRPVGEVAGQLADWERELGLPLVDGERLTPAGRRLADHAGTLLGQLESAESDAAAIAGRVAGTLRLGVGADAGRVLLADALATLRSTELTLHVRQLADEQVGALDSTLDAILVGEYGAAVPHPADAGVERRELLTEPLLLAVPSRHPSSGASVRLAELSGEAWIGGSGDALLALERAAAAAGFAPRLVAEVDEDALALTLVGAGLGVTLVPASAAPSPAGGVRLLTVLDGGLRRTVVAAVRRSRAADPGVRWLLDALAASARRVAAAVPGVTAAVAPAAAPPAGPAGGPARRPDPLFDPLPAEPPAPRSNGRRDPWADRVRPEANGLDLPARNGSNGAGPGGIDLPPRNGTPPFGTPAGTDLPPPPRSGAELPPLPPPGGELPPLPPPGGELPPLPPPGGELPPLPGRSGSTPPYGSPAVPPGAEAPGRPGPADLPGRPVDRSEPPGADDLSSLSGLSGFGRAGDLPSGHDLSGRGSELSGRGSDLARGPSSFGPPADGPGRLPAPGGRTADPQGPGTLPPAAAAGGPAARGTDRPGPGERGPGERGPGERGPGEPYGPGALPAPGAGPSNFGDLGGGLPAPGGELPQRGGTSPYRTPPPTGDAPGFVPDLPSRGESSGPNPYRPDTSAHPTPDPFRGSGGTEPGPNPYRSNGSGQASARRDSIGGAELFSAGQRSAAPRAADLPPTGHPSRARGGDGAQGTLPPAPAGAADDVRLSIFEDLQSEWFVQRDEGARAPAWQMAADDGWAAAARLAEPTTAGTTTAGLPRRRPQAMVVPGAVGGAAGPGSRPQPNTTHRSPQEVRGRLSSYRDGVRRGRHAERPADEE